MNKGLLQVCLQQRGQGLHPISRQILTTARRLASDSGRLCQGVLFASTAAPSLLQELENSGLDEVILFLDPVYSQFYPELMGKAICSLEKPDILLFAATPEGRLLSSAVAAYLETGVTADCTALSFTSEGLLLQTRPAFSGSRMADILTVRTTPQIASLRFGMETARIRGKTVIRTVQGLSQVPYPAIWTEQAGIREETEKIVLAIGGGLREKADLALFSALSAKLGAELLCSRALVERGWMDRSRQIGLSGRAVECRLLIACGISGSVQFRAGLQKVDTLCVIDRNPDTALMKLADLPLAADLYEVAQALLKT